MVDYKKLIGKTIRIDFMYGEPRYAGKTGVVTLVDDAYQLHGTWGGCAVIPGTDSYTVLEGGAAMKEIPRVQPGEFVSVWNGIAQVTRSIEAWGESEDGAPVYRELSYMRLTLMLRDMQSLVRHFEGFGGLERHYDQSVFRCPYSQSDFERFLTGGGKGTKVLTTSEFLKLDQDKLNPDDTEYYFVIYSPSVLTAEERDGILKDWEEDGRPPLCPWIERKTKEEPRLDSPWIAQEIFDILNAEVEEEFE